MDEKNPFLDAYKNKLGEPAAAAQPPEAAKPAADAPLRFEERSEFRRVAPEQAAPVRRPAKKTLALAVWAVVVLAVAVLLIWYFTRGVAVIDLKNWALTDAQLWSSDNKLKLQVEQVFNDQFTAGRIISQNPAAGTRLKTGSFLQVTVSRGHDLTVELPLPDLLSMNKSEVEAWAAENFMDKVYITAEFSDTVPSGDVISFEISDNTVVDKVKRNTPIFVVVSKGKEDPAAEPVTIPDFRQMTLAQCEAFAEEKGIVLKIVEAFDDDVPKGGIVAQSVKADSEVNPGDTVTLTVSKGKKILVPDFSEFNKQSAGGVASGLGITASIIEKYSSKKAGDFISQSLAAGSIYQPSDVLELTYSLGNRVILPSFVGQTKAAIDTWASELNKQGASISVKTTYTQSESPKDVILYQDKSNSSIGTVSTIYITVSLGKLVFVPDLVAPEGSAYDLAITREKATALCAEAGIIPVFVAESKSGRLPGEIWYQSVTAGSEIYQGKTITLKYVPPGPAVAIPDFKGQTQAQIIGDSYLFWFDITFVTAFEYVDGYADRVFRQSVLPGTLVARGTAITLTVSPPES